MALVSCDECKAQISDQSLQCPHCGAPRKVQAPVKRSNKALNIVLAVIVTPILIIWAIWGIAIIKESSMTPEERRIASAARAEGDAPYDARNFCERMVIASLKAPGTAKLQDKTMVIQKRENGEFVIGGQVDAQNSFGAMLRNTFVCTVKRGATGQLELALPISMTN